MKKFLAIYLGTPTGANFTKWQALSPEEQNKRTEAGMKAWGAWAEKNAKVIRDIGGPLGKTKQIDPKGISDTRNNLSAFTVVEAESAEAAAKLFVDHPHFSIFPGDSVEVVEILPIPGR